MAELGSRVVARSLRTHFVRTTQLMAGRSAATVVQAVTLVGVARLSGARAFGVLAALIAVTGFVAVIGDFGVGTMILRARARRETVVVARYLRGTLFALALVGLSSSVVIWVWADRYSLPSALVLLGIGSACEKFADNALMLAVADGRTSVVARSLVLRRFVTLGVGALVLWLHADALESYSAGYFVGSAVALALVLPEVRGAWAPGPWIGRGTLREAIPFGVSSIAAQARTLDVTIVNAIAGSQAAGTYAAASRTMSPFVLLAGSISSAIVPETARRGLGYARRVGSVVGAGAIAASLLLGGLFPFAGWAMAFLFGESFRSGGPVLELLLVGSVWISYASLLEAMLQSVGREHVVAAVSLVSGTAVLGAIVAGARLDGVVGASFGFAAFTVLRSGVLVYLLERGWGGKGSLRARFGRAAH